MIIDDFSDVRWRKSSRSASYGSCVEVARLDRAMAVRDSKNPNGPVLVFQPRELTAFITGQARS